MCTSYTDGTKLNIEMALVANAIGASAAVPGMHGPRTSHVSKIFDHLQFSELWDGRRPLVDYVLGAEPTGGVFVVGYSDNEYQQSMLAWFPPKMGTAPFYLFYRPYHLCHIEIMRCVAEAFLDGTALLQPKHGFQTNVFTYAKRDLRRGEHLDGIGGYACYGLIENCRDGETHPGLPICVAEGAVLKRDVARDERILSCDVEMRQDDPALVAYTKAVEQLRAVTR
jgi:predicted homoserine dehydrogenase-like protein